MCIGNGIIWGHFSGLVGLFRISCKLMLSELCWKEHGTGALTVVSTPGLIPIIAIFSSCHHVALYPIILTRSPESSVS